MVNLLVRHVQTSIQSISFSSEFTLKIILVLKDSLLLFWWFHYGCCIIFFFFFRCSSLWFSAVLKEYAFGFFLIWGYGSTEDFCFVSTINPTSTFCFYRYFMSICTCVFAMYPRHHVNVKVRVGLSSLVPSQKF